MRQLSIKKIQFQLTVLKNSFFKLRICLKNQIQYNPNSLIKVISPEKLSNIIISLKIINGLEK
jgi:hypothetical protein